MNDPFALADPQKTASDPFALNADSSGPATPLPEKPGPFMAGVRQATAGIRQAGGGLVAMAGRGFGVRGLEDYGHDVINRADADSAANTMNVEDVNSIGSGVDFAKYAIGNLLPYALITAVLGVGGRTAAGMASKKVAEVATREMVKNVGTIAGPAAFNVGVEAGGIYPDAEKMKVENPIARSIGGGLIAGSLDTAFPAFIMGKLGLLGAKAATRAAGVRGLLDHVGKEALKGGFIEGGTEVAQTGVERAAAGQPMDDAEAISSYLNAGAVGAIGGHVVGGAAGALAKPNTPSSQPALADPFAAPPVAAEATNVVSEATPAVAQQSEKTQATPLPSLKMVKSEFPEIQTQLDLTPNTLYGRIEQLKGNADELDTRIQSLQDETASKTRGRTKQAIRLELEKAKTERMDLGRRLDNLNTLASTPDYQGKSGSVDNGVLVATSHEASPSIVTPKAPQPLAVVTNTKPGFMNSATEMVELGKIKQRAAELEVPITPRRARETIKVPDVKAQQEVFLERAGRVAETNVDSLVQQGIIAPESKAASRTIIYKSVKSALEEKTVEDAKATIRAGVERAVSRKLLKQDVDGFVDKVMADLAGPSNTEDAAPVATPAQAPASDPFAPQPAAQPAAPGPVVAEATSADVGSKAAPVKLREGVEGFRKDGEWYVKQADVRGVESWPKVTGPNTKAEYDALAPAPEPKPEVVAQQVERPAVLVLGKVGRTPLHAEPLAIRANPQGGYDLFQGGYAVQDFNTAEPISYPPEMSTAAILKDVKERSKDLFGNKSRFYEEKGRAFNSQSAVDEHLRSVVGTEQERLAENGRVVLEALGRIIGSSKRLEVRLMQAQAGEAVGRTSLRPQKDTIAVATNAKDVLSVAYHEGFHYIEERVLDGSERLVLNRGLAPGTKLFEQVLARAKQYDYENKTDIAAEISAKPEEAHAYGFEMWKRGELAVKGTIERVLAKLREVITRVGNAMRGAGFRSVLDIYAAIDAGEYAARNPMDRTVSGTLESRASIGETAFQKWFGKSKVVDGKGQPLVVYHGTGSDFSEFSMKGRAYLNGMRTAGASWFTPDSSRASWSAENLPKMRGEEDAAASVYPVYLALKNPLVLKPSDFKGSGFHSFGLAYPTLGERSKIIESGYDGLILSETGRATDASEILAFDPTQIKSAVGNVGTYDPMNPNILYSRAAVVDMAQLMQDGQLKPQQLMAESSRFFDGLDLPAPTLKQVLGVSKESIGGSLKRFYLENIASGTFIARDSRGFGNVFGVLTGHKQRKDFLISQGVDDMLSKWDARRGTSQEDITAVGKALFQRTEGALAQGSAEYQALLAPLSQTQRDMLEQANKMIADRLQQEFTADQKTMQALLGPATPQYAEWFANRQLKVQQLVNEGYVPERRYGDHVVHVTVTVKDAAGNPKPLTMLREQFETEAEAKARLAQYTTALEGDPAFKPQYEYKYAAQYDGSLSYQQFLDMARRQGIELTQVERERMARAMVSSDSVRNNRIFRRSNVPGYSKDVYRVLSEFAVTMANKIAYSEFSDAISSASQGNEVQVTVKQGMPQIAVDRETDLWAGDGPMAGFYRNLSDQRIDYVMQRDPGGDWSRNARAAASVYFLGGSLSAGMVQLSSLPMNTVPYLYQHTGYGNAFAKVAGAMKDVASNFGVLRDISRLKDTAYTKIDAIDSVPGMRQALIEAAQDGTVLDTEIYHIMGTTRGGMLSRSPRVQKAMDAWMAPFRMAEQMNRYSTFVAAYKVGLENGLAGDQLYKFAQESVYNTQFRYDEANRPGLAHNPVWAILFTFKSYPIFMSEMVVGLFKQSPRAGVAMLMSLAAAAGVNGLPFAEDLMDLVDTISQRIFGSPFNSKRAIRNMLKSASEAIVGADMSGLMMNGMVNELTGMSFASRVGLGNMIPGSRAFTADADYKKNVEEIVGPVASMVGGAAQGAIAVARGNPLEAARVATPLAVQNVVKAYEQFTKGYATDSSGRKLADVNSWEAFAQLVGFSSAELAQAYDLDRLDRQTQAFYKEAQKDFTNDIVQAVQSGNKEKVTESYQAVVQWNTAHPEMPMVLGGVRHALAEAGMPMNERTLKMLPRALRAQSVAMETRGGQ